MSRTKKDKQVRYRTNFDVKWETKAHKDYMRYTRKSKYGDEEIEQGIENHESEYDLIDLEDYWLFKGKP